MFSYSKLDEPKVIELHGRIRVLATVKWSRQTTANIGVVSHVPSGARFPEAGVELPSDAP